MDLEWTLPDLHRDMLLIYKATEMLGDAESFDAIVHKYPRLLQACVVLEMIFTVIVSHKSFSRAQMTLLCCCVDIIYLSMSRLVELQNIFSMM